MDWAGLGENVLSEFSLLAIISVEQNKKGTKQICRGYLQNIKRFLNTSLNQLVPGLTIMTSDIFAHYYDSHSLLCSATTATAQISRYIYYSIVILGLIYLMDICSGTTMQKIYL